MSSIWILARMTFREAIRRRIVLTGLLLGLAFLVIFSIGFHMIYAAAIQGTEIGPDAMAHVAQGEATNVLLLAGLYAVAFLSVAMGALLGADTLAGEITSGTIQTIVTKPVRRSDVVLGKWLGFAGLLALYSVLMSGGTVLSVFIQAGSQRFVASQARATAPVMTNALTTVTSLTPRLPRKVVSTSWRSFLRSMPVSTKTAASWCWWARAWAVGCRCWWHARGLNGWPGWCWWTSPSRCSKNWPRSTQPQTGETHLGPATCRRVRAADVTRVCFCLVQAKHSRISTC